MPVYLDIVTTISDIVVPSLWVGKPCSEVFLEHVNKIAYEPIPLTDLWAIFLELWCNVGLVHVGELFNVRELVDVESVPSIEWMPIQCISCKSSGVRISEFDKYVPGLDVQRKEKSD